MRFSRSIRYLPRPEWPDALYSRALSASSHSGETYLHECLEGFRRYDPFHANRLEGIEHWQDIPPLQKNELAAVPVNTSQPLHETRSSGTTGCQAVVRNTLSERRFRQALAYRPFLFYPVTPDATNTVRQLIFVDGTEVEPADKEQWPFEFGGRSYLTWRAGIAAAPDRIHTLIKLVRPHVIRGLTSGIVRFVEELDRPLDGFGVQVVSPSGEQLPDQWRTSLNNGFAAPVLDRYGATEVGSMAWQCPYCHHYHVNSDEIIVEASSEGVLATPLFIESQPLLRYRLDDRIELHDGNNNCRVRLPTLTVLDARRDDWIIDGAGLKVSPLSFQFEGVAGLKAWQLHQLDSGNLRLYFDSETAISDIRPQLAKQLERIVPGQNIELVEGLWSLERGGKFKRVSSDL